MWVAGEGIQTFPTIAAMLDAAKATQAAGNEVYATYVYDHPTGLKLFGKAAYLVLSDSGAVVAFMKKSDSEQYVATHGGNELLKGKTLAMLP